MDKRREEGIRDDGGDDEVVVVVVVEERNLTLYNWIQIINLHLRIWYQL
jgi:hypothetical protein